MDTLLNKQIAVPVMNFRRFTDEDTNVYTIINKIGEVELTDAAKKKIEYRLQNNLMPPLHD